MDGDLQIHFADTGLCVATWRNVYINVWYGRATLERLQHVRAAELALVERYRGGIVAVIVMSTDSVHGGLPDEAVRKESAAIAKLVDPQMLAHAYVVEGSGFAAAGLRALISTVMLVSRSEAPHKTCATVSDAAAWLGRQVAQRPGAATLRADDVLAAVRAAEARLRSQVGRVAPR